ncbi:MAG: phosphatase PAP2 family protein [Ruminococcaceae bacterium]|nr:phosphatase PAP2 family protein [Oscillospiraceae bacterium]
MKKNNFFVALAIGSALLFLALVALVETVDVKAIGPLGSSVGLSAVNGKVRDAIGYSKTLYSVAEILGYAALASAAGFALLGLVQLIKRRSLKKIDKDLYLLGGFYVVVLAVYVLFEIIVINERPVLMDGELEASFPSSHTMLAICILSTAAHQLYVRLSSSKSARIVSVALCVAFATLSVVCRLLSGVHWFTDIIGGILISGALVFAYFFAYGKLFGAEEK